MKRIWMVCVLLVATGCSLSLPNADKGVVAMVPFWDEGMQIHGVMPLDGWSEEALLLQQSFAGSREDFVAEVVQQTDLVTLPKPRGTYQGAHLSWELFTFHTQLEGAPPGIYRVDAGISERAGAQYFVFLISVPATYDQQQRMYEAVFEHALYALQPWQKEG